ncbi:hypothetical protein H0H93_004159 [Arthromyces matolae]|nr:hypothetical protein H0H93_004159 [Arthromyces matolae]
MSSKKTFIYEAIRQPSSLPPLPSDYDRPPTPDVATKKLEENFLSVWQMKPRIPPGAIEYIEANTSSMQAPKTIAIWSRVISVLLDPKQVRLRKIFQGLMLPESRAPEVDYEKALSFLKTNTPILTLFEYKLKRDIATADLGVRERIFLCSKLARAYEATPGTESTIEGGDDLETQLGFLTFNALLHEMAHWLRYDPGNRVMSREQHQYEDWHGIELSNADMMGEAGYYIEGKLWGGIIEYAFQYQGSDKKRPRGLYRRPGNDFRRFEDIAVIMRHPGKIRDVKREQVCESDHMSIRRKLINLRGPLQIAVQAMARCLQPEFLIEGFKNEDLVLLTTMEKVATQVWTVDDSTPSEENLENDEPGRRKSKRQRQLRVKGRTVLPEDVEMLFNDSNFDVEKCDEFIIVQDEK